MGEYLFQDQNSGLMFDYAVGREKWWDGEEGNEWEEGKKKGMLVDQGGERSRSNPGTSPSVEKKGETKKMKEKRVV